MNSLPPHVYLFMDGQPSDSLADGNDTDWRTLAFILVSANWQSHISSEYWNFQDLLLSDESVLKFLYSLKEMMQITKLQKFSALGPVSKKSYRQRLAQAIPDLICDGLSINAVSYQGKTLRETQTELLKYFNSSWAPSSFGFSESLDKKNRTVKSHMRVTGADGLKKIEGTDDKVLVLLLMATCIVKQYNFYSNQFTKDFGQAFENLKMTVVSDRLAGDGSIETGKATLDLFLKPDGSSLCGAESDIELIRSEVSDTFALDLLVDNVAGLFNLALNDPTNETSKLLIQNMSASGQGWKKLAGSSSIFEDVSFP